MKRWTYRGRILLVLLAVLMFLSACTIGGDISDTVSDDTVSDSRDDAESESRNYTESEDAFSDSQENTDTSEENTTKPPDTSSDADTSDHTQPDTPPETYSLPVVYIRTDNGAPIDSKEEYVKGTVEINGRDSGYASIPELSAQIRGRGHYSWTKDKKPYKIKFDEAVSVMGLGSGRQWVLLANHSDKALIRNYVAHQIGKVLGHLAYRPSQYLVELYVNGKYQGVYTMGEQLQVKGNRIDIDESYTDPNTGYLLEIGGVDTDTDIQGRDYFFAGYARWVRIKSPDSEQMTKEQFDYIKKYFEDTDKAIRAMDGYEEYIDVMSFIDWAILHELSYNLDSCFRRSCYFVKDKDGLLKMGPAWDFDLAFGNFFKDNEKYDDFAVIGPGTEDILDPDILSGIKPLDYSYDDYYVLVTWFNYLMADDAFYAKYQVRWNEIKDALYAAAMDAVNHGEEILSQGAWSRNFSIWRVDQRVGSEPKFILQYKTLKAQISYLRNFIENRYHWLDQALNTPR